MLTKKQHSKASSFTICDDEDVENYGEYPRGGCPLAIACDDRAHYLLQPVIVW